VLTAQGPDCLDICEAHQVKFRRHSLMREGITDAPRKRARPAVFMPDTFIHDETHDRLRSCGALRAADAKLQIRPGNVSLEMAGSSGGFTEPKGPPARDRR
jgi:hypothetical protein